MRLFWFVIIFVLAVLGAFFAGRWLGEDKGEVDPQPVFRPATVAVRLATLQTTTFASVEVSHAPVLKVRGRGGIVTSVELDGSELNEGDVPYSSNLRPAFLFEGTVPMFRSITLGTTGPDVAQIQEALTRLGYYEGPIDSEYGRATRNAWQRFSSDAGVLGARTVEMGDVVFSPTVPVMVANSSLEVGDEAVGEVMTLTEPQPTVVAIIPSSARSAVAVGLDVEVIVESSIVPGVIATLEPSGDSIRAELSIDANRLPANAALRARVMGRASAEGLVVPVTAIYSDAAGRTYVRRLDDRGSSTEVLVSVVESNGEDALIEGDLSVADEVIVGS